MAEKSLQDIEGEAYENMQKTVYNTMVKAEDYKCRLKKLESRIDSLETFVSDHFESVHQEVNATYAKRKKVKAEEEITLINEEANEEIRLVNQKRDDRIKECLKKAEQQEDVISDDQQELISEIEKISETIKKDVGLDEMKSRNKKNINDVDDIKCRIARNQHMQSVTENKSIGQISATLEELSSAFHDQDTAAYMYLDKLQLEVQKVQFLRGQLNGEYYARIDGYVGKWELVKSVPSTCYAYYTKSCSIPSRSDVIFTKLVSQITNDSVCMSHGGDYMYVSSISNGNSEQIFNNFMMESESSLLETGGTGSYSYIFRSCAPLDSSIIVRGKRNNAGQWGGCITVHDRQWKLVRDITLPKSTDGSRYGNEMYFDVDKNGMILVAEGGQSLIYVINPVDGKIMDTVTVQDIEVWGRCTDIKALSSGDIAIVAEKGLTVISRSGEKKASIPYCHDWEYTTCQVDKLTDTFYITYPDRERGIYAVDQVSSECNFRARRIIEFEKQYKAHNGSVSIITPAGNLLARSRHNLLIYKKSFVVGGSAGIRSTHMDTVCCCDGCLWNRATWSLD